MVMVAASPSVVMASAAASPSVMAVTMATPDLDHAVVRSWCQFAHGHRGGGKCQTETKQAGGCEGNERAFHVFYSSMRLRRDQQSAVGDKVPERSGNFRLVSRTRCSVSSTVHRSGALRCVRGTSLCYPARTAILR
jgi:hypothetical protein